MNGNEIVGKEDVWICQAQDWVQRRGLASNEINFRVPKKKFEFINI
jgi:hypothetical protein